jgi:hypothetical protein
MRNTLSLTGMPYPAAVKSDHMKKRPSANRQALREHKPRLLLACPNHYEARSLKAPQATFSQSI